MSIQRRANQHSICCASMQIQQLTRENPLLMSFILLKNVIPFLCNLHKIFFLNKKEAIPFIWKYIFLMLHICFTLDTIPKWGIKIFPIVGTYIVFHRWSYKFSRDDSVVWVDDPNVSTLLLLASDVSWWWRYDLKHISQNKEKLFYEVCLRGFIISQMDQFVETEMQLVTNNIWMHLRIRGEPSWLS